MKKEDWIKKISTLCRDLNNSLLLNSVIIAQASLETGFGQSQLMINANAYFGIKATKSWKGKTYSSVTKEYYDKWVNVQGLFRAYDTPKEGIEDYLNLILNTRRYKTVINYNTPESQLNEIIKCGYATDPNYVTKCMKLIKEYNLTSYDNKKSNEEVATDVILGKYGNGKERKEKLEVAGYNYEVIQKIVNERVRKIIKKSNEEIAADVILGKYGNGQERKEKLEAAGYNYQVIQKIVNERLMK